MSTLRLLILAGGSSIGLSIPVSSRLKFSRNPVISRVILGILHPVHTFNPESRPRFALKSRIPNLISRNPVILMFFFWDPATRAYFQSRTSPSFCFKIPNPELRTREIPYPEPYLAQFRNPDGYFRNPASRAYFQFRILLLLCYKIDIPNAGKQTSRRAFLGLFGDHLPRLQATLQRRK